VVRSFRALERAVRAARPGDTVAVARDLRLPRMLELDKPLRLVGLGDGKKVRLAATGRHPVLVAYRHVVLECLELVGYDPPVPWPVPPDYRQCMCAVDARSTLVLRGCVLSSYGSCLILNRRPAPDLPGAARIVDSVFRDALCAAICVVGGEEPLRAFDLRGNSFLRNGWVCQQEGTTDRPLADRLLEHNSLDGNGMLCLA
jgi:hypothetical protein